MNHRPTFTRYSHSRRLSSRADTFQVLLWGEESQIRQAFLQLEALDCRIQPTRWAKNHAYDGRKESRKDLMAVEEEQAARLETMAESKDCPFEVMPSSDLHDPVLNTCSTLSSGQKATLTSSS